METGYLIALILLFSFMMFVFQRTEAKKRRIIAFMMLIVFLFIRDWVLSRAIVREANTAFIIALVVNLLFWALIGRYNPVPSSDEIQVLGLDD